MSTPAFRPLRRFAFLMALVCALPVSAQTEVTGFGSNPGNLRMFKFVPTGLPANAPLLGTEAL